MQVNIIRQHPINQIKQRSLLCGIVLLVDSKPHQAINHKLIATVFCPRKTEDFQQPLHPGFAYSLVQQ